MGPDLSDGLSQDMNRNGRLWIRALSQRKQESRRLIRFVHHSGEVDRTDAEATVVAPLSGVFLLTNDQLPLLVLIALIGIAIHCHDQRQGLVQDDLHCAIKRSTERPIS
jgi:hypothetical protein